MKTTFYILLSCFLLGSSCTTISNLYDAEVIGHKNHKVEVSGIGIYNSELKPSSGEINIPFYPMVNLQYEYGLSKKTDLNIGLNSVGFFQFGIKRELFKGERWAWSVRPMIHVTKYENLILVPSFGVLSSYKLSENRKLIFNNELFFGKGTNNYFAAGSYNFGYSWGKKYTWKIGLAATQTYVGINTDTQFFYSMTTGFSAPLFTRMK